MIKKIQIGELTFNYKKDALLHFKNILNSYNYGETLNSEDYVDVLNLLKTHKKEKEKIGSGVKEFKVDEIRYKTKCFYIIRNDSTSDIFSYTKCINGSSSEITKFNKTCRDLISDNLRSVKLSYFKARSKKGKVKCQETGELSFWEELNVDHRQPNTFSVIVDRFIEINQIDLSTVEYIETVDSVYVFKDSSLSKKFQEYHKAKANLRLVRKDKNLGRSHQARVKRQKRDLVIE